MKCYFAGTTDKGCVRSVNQDSYYMDPEGRFFIVADGMGGHAGGQEASKIAIEAMESYLVKHWDDSISSPQLLEEAFLKANDAILADQREHPDRSDMGTTAVVVMFRDGEEEQAWCANMGDSRLYKLGGEKLQQITEDQTWVAQAVRQNALTREEARVHPWRHVLSQCLGREDLGTVDLIGFTVQPGDRLLLCSDGLTEELPDEAIAPLLANTDSDRETLVKELVEAAKEEGGRDNITVVVVAMEGE